LDHMNVILIFGELFFSLPRIILQKFVTLSITASDCLLSFFFAQRRGAPKDNVFTEENRSVGGSRCGDGVHEKECDGRVHSDSG
jgi:hypothetical protein